jgi:hypothetical protein
MADRLVFGFMTMETGGDAGSHVNLGVISVIAAVDRHWALASAPAALWRLLHLHSPAASITWTGGAGVCPEWEGRVNQSSDRAPSHRSICRFPFWLQPQNTSLAHAADRTALPSTTHCAAVCRVPPPATSRLRHHHSYAVERTMAEPGGDFLAELTTAPIFDDAVYLAEALQLPVNEDEDDLDTELAMSARESGIEDPYRILYPDAHLISPSMSMISLRSEHRNSPSIHSRETQSTNFTSPTSRASRDEFYKEQPPVLRTPPLLSRASLSVDQPATIGHTLPGIRHRHSSSASRSSAPESLSAPSSARKPSTRKHKRGSALFSMFRKDARWVFPRSLARHLAHSLSSNTISPSRRPRSKGPGFETSPCLSQLVVRAYAIGALDGNDISYTGPKLDTLVTTDELVSVTRSALTSSASQSLRDSGYSEDGISTVDLSHALDHDKAQPTSLATPVLETCWQDEHGFHMALANEAFKSMMAEQRQQLQRVSKFESDQRKALLSHHQWSLKRLRTQWKTTKAKRKKQVSLPMLLRRIRSLIFDSILLSSSD